MAGLIEHAANTGSADLQIGGGSQVRMAVSYRNPIRGRACRVRVGVRARVKVRFEVGVIESGSVVRVRAKVTCSRRAVQCPNPNPNSNPNLT